MWTFWLWAVLMVTVAAGLALLPLRRRQPDRAISQDAVDTAIFRERLAELEIERHQGGVDAERYRELRAELERTLLHDVPADNASVPPLQRSTRQLAGIMAVLVPVLALGYYYVSSYRGDAAAWLAVQDRLDSLMAQAVRDPATLAAHQDLDMRDFTRVLQARVAKDGMSDPDGLFLLGVSYLKLQQIEAAREALARAYQLQPQRPDIMLVYAQAQLFINDGRLDEDTAALLQRVLQANPHNQKALFLFGLGAFNSGRYEETIAAWESLLTLRGDSDSEGAKALQNSIARARALLAERDQTAAGPRLGITVELAPSLKQRLAPDATLFVFARAVDGPPMPLAAVRQVAKDFPVQVMLDDRQAVTPAVKLSQFKRVVVSARISTTGDAAVQSGDLQGATGPLQLGEGTQPVTLVIDQVVP